MYHPVDNYVKCGQGVTDDPPAKESNVVFLSYKEVFNLESLDSVEVAQQM